MGRGANANLTTPLCVEYVDDYAIVYLLAPNNGMAAYKIYRRGASTVEPATDDGIRIFASNSLIQVEGVAPGQSIAVYDLKGRLIQSTVAESGCTTITNSQPGQTYIVVTSDQAVKVCL